MTHSPKTCPVGKVAALLSDTWTMLVLRDLLKKPMRYGELFESLEGISSRTLILKLKRLEELKMIVKKEPAYAITLKGKKLATIFDEMAKYGKKHL